MRDENWQAVMQDPAVLQADIRRHLEAENEYAQAVLAPTRALQTTLFEEMKGRIKEDDATVPAPDGPWLYWTQFETGGQHPIFCRAPRPDGASDPVGDLDRAKGQVMLHGDAMAQGHGYFDIGAAGHSPDHRFLAYAVDTQGSELFTIRIRDLTSGEDLPADLTGTAGDFAWSADASRLLYVRRDANLRPSSVWCHRLHTDPAEDICLYEEPDPAYYVGLDETESGAYLLIEAGNHDATEIRLIDAHAPEAPPILLAPRRPGHLYSATHHGDRLLIVTNSGDAEDFRIVSAPLEDPRENTWQEILPHRQGRLILSLLLFERHAVRLERVDGLPRIVIAGLGPDGFAGETAIAFEEEAYHLSLMPGHEFKTDTLRFTYASPTSPAQVVDYDMATTARTVRKVQDVPSGHDPSDYVVRRLLVTAADGAEIPVTLLHRADTAPGPDTPVLLYGYGSYGHATPASFSVTRLSLVDRGFLYAIAHVRGGMEKGYHWYTDGKLDQKMNTFTDFVAVGEALAAKGLTRRGRIIAHGGSAGGLLVGAAANLAPDLFQAILAEVPFVDVLTTICDDSLPLTPPEWVEWGNPIAEKSAFDTIAAYSPYDNVAETVYPAVFATAGLTDPRVTYWEPAKWVARLRERRTDDGLTVLWTHMEAGHAGAAGRFDHLKEIARVYAFALAVANGTIGAGTPMPDDDAHTGTPGLAE